VRARSPEDLQAARSMAAAAAIVAGTCGFADAAVTLGRTGSVSPTPGTIGAALFALLCSAGLLGLAGGAVLLGASRLAGGAPVQRLLLLPGALLLRLASPVPQDLPRLASLAAHLCAAALAFGAFFAGTYASLVTLHEPVRMALLCAAIGVVSAAVARLVASGLAVPFLALLRRAGRALAIVSRVAIALGAAALAAAAAYVLVEADDVFGALNPWPFAVAAMFVLGLPVAASLCGSRSRMALAPRSLLVFSAVTLAAGFAIVTASAHARACLRKGGALGASVMGLAYRGLDFDGDGFAWLVGGDCHPFDPASNPYVAEIPGNGYDENCDGSDARSAGERFPDPIDRMPPTRAELTRRRGNVLLVIMDAVSARRMSLYGARRKTTRYLDAFARQECVVFDHFFSVSNHTSVSMPSLLTGLYPSVFPDVRALAWNSFPLAESFRPLQSRLTREGYETIVQAGHNMGGFLKGFGSVHTGRRRNVAKAQQLARVARNELHRVGPSPARPVFLLVHFFDPHHPYAAQRLPFRFGHAPADRYDAELAYTDENLGSLLDLMQGDGYEDWLVIVTSDHGESFKEHGTPHHGHVLYDEETHVPLVMRVPGAEPERIRTAAGHLDLVPTVLEWAGLPADPSLPGRSLLRLVGRSRERGVVRRIVFSESFKDGDRFAAFDGRRTLLSFPEDDLFELYDTALDPGQKRDLYGAAAAPRLEAALRGHIAASLERLHKGETRGPKVKPRARKAPGVKGAARAR
jgi:choline-sulfatase